MATSSQNMILIWIFEHWIQDGSQEGMVRDQVLCADAWSLDSTS